ncbi:hypothetical protein NQZ68_020000 [Dissostichus eleginoides]|nr:hypothetical protein NQZ68_020000 [Dissostichus eleginoides]
MGEPGDEEVLFRFSTSLSGGPTLSFKPDDLTVSAFSIARPTRINNIDQESKPPSNHAVLCPEVSRMRAVSFTNSVGASVRSSQ